MHNNRPLRAIKRKYYVRAGIDSPREFYRIGIRARRNVLNAGHKNDENVRTRKRNRYY